MVPLKYDQEQRRELRHTDTLTLPPSPFQMTTLLLSDWLPPWLAITCEDLLMNVDRRGNDRMRFHCDE